MSYVWLPVVPPGMELSGIRVSSPMVNDAFQLVESPVGSRLFEIIPHVGGGG